MPLSAYAKDNFIAPGLSTFTSACIRDMAGTSVEQEHWLNNYMLNTLFRVKLDEQVRQSLFNFLRRSQFAFREFALAREQTASYLRSVDAVTTYFVAIGHWEVFLAYSYQAFELLAGSDKRALFEPGDGSVLQRLCLLYNRSKHVKKAISNGQLAAGSILAVWLTNEGLHAVDGHLTFDEMAEILEDLARWSDAAQDPLTMREKLMIHYPEAGDTGDAAGGDHGKR
jgi:hypothetical protein